MTAPRYAGPAYHWSRVNDLRRTEVPDLLGAARESVHTVEGLAKIVAGLPNATLGDCIKDLRNRGVLNPAIAKQLEGLWGFVNTASGLRHGAHEMVDIEEAELLYTMDASEAAAQMRSDPYIRIYPADLFLPVVAAPGPTHSLSQAFGVPSGGREDRGQNIGDSPSQSWNSPTRKEMMGISKARMGRFRVS